MQIKKKLEKQLKIKKNKKFKKIESREMRKGN